MIHLHTGQRYRLHTGKRYRLHTGKRYTLHTGKSLHIYPVVKGTTYSIYNQSLRMAHSYTAIQYKNKGIVPQLGRTNE